MGMKDPRIKGLGNCEISALRKRKGHFGHLAHRSPRGDKSNTYPSPSGAICNQGDPAVGWETNGGVYFVASTRGEQFNFPMMDGWSELD